MKLTRRTSSNRKIARDWKLHSTIADFEKSEADTFTRSTLTRFEPQRSLGQALAGLRNSTVSAFHKAVGFGIGAFWLGLGATVAGSVGATGLAVGLGLAGAGAAALAVKNSLDTGTDYVGYRKVDKAVGGRFQGDKRSAEAFGFAGGIAGGILASSLGAPALVGAIPGAVVAGVIGYHYVGEILKEIREG